MIFEELKQMANDVGMTLPQLCKAADVQWRTVKVWRKRDPKTIEIIRKLQHKIKELK